MRKARAGGVEHACWTKNQRRRSPAGRSFSSDVVELGWVHVGAEATDLPQADCAVGFVGPTLHRVDKRGTK